MTNRMTDNVTMPGKVIGQIWQLVNTAPPRSDETRVTLFDEAAEAWRLQQRALDEKRQRHFVKFRRDQAAYAKTRLCITELSETSLAGKVAKYILEAFAEVEPRDGERRVEAAFHVALNRLSDEERSARLDNHRRRGLKAAKDALNQAHEALKKTPTPGFTE